MVVASHYMLSCLKTQHQGDRVSSRGEISDLKLVQICRVSSRGGGGGVGATKGHRSRAFLGADVMGRCISLNLDFIFV